MQDSSKNISPLTYAIQGTNLNDYSNYNQNNIQLQTFQPQLIQQQISNPMSNVGINSTIQPNLQTISPQYTQIIGNQNYGTNQLITSQDQIISQGNQTNLYPISQNTNQILIGQNAGIQQINPSYLAVVDQQNTGNAQLYSSPSQASYLPQTIQNNLISSNQNLNAFYIGQDSNSIQNINANLAYPTIVGQGSLGNTQVISSDGQLISQPITTNIVSTGIYSNNLMQGQNLAINNLIQPTSIQEVNQVNPEVMSQQNFSTQPLNAQTIGSIGIGISQPIDSNNYNTAISYPQIANQDSSIEES